MKKHGTFVFVVGLLALAFLSGPMVGKTLAATKKLTYVMAWIPDGRWASEAVAKYRGYFKAEGLDVSLKWAKGSRNSAKQTASGGADFCSTTGSVVLTSREKGIPLRTIAQTLPKSGTSFISLKKTGIKGPKDLMGKKVGVQRGSTTWVGFQALMNKYNVDIGKLNKIEVGFGLKPLVSGVVDIRPAMYYNEVVLARHKGIPVNVIWLPEHGINLVGLGVTTTERMLKDDPGTARKFVRAVLKGYEHAKKDPADAVKAVVEHKADHDPAYQRKVVDLIFSKIAVPAKNGIYGWADRDEWNGMQENFVKFGVMKKRVNVDDAFTNRFVAEYYGKKAK
jgi:ABC-type nitrate/sulfonate/bicarbonate transport system substrate-binding protein